MHAISQMLFSKAGVYVLLCALSENKNQLLLNLDDTFSHSNADQNKRQVIVMMFTMLYARRRHTRLLRHNLALLIFLDRAEKHWYFQLCISIFAAITQANST